MKSKMVLLNIIWGSVTIAALVFGWAGYKQGARKPLTTAQAVTMADKYNQITNNQEKNLFFQNLIKGNKPLISFNTAGASQCSEWFQQAAAYMRRMGEIASRNGITGSLRERDGSIDPDVVSAFIDEFPDEDRDLMGAYSEAFNSRIDLLIRYCSEYEDFFYK